MKKRFYLACLAIASTVVCGGIAACSKGGSSDDSSSSISVNPTVAFEYESITLDRYERANLSVETANYDGTVAWAVSDPTVCVVENGVVVAKAVGETAVTVTAGSATDVCIVKVQDTGAKPTIVNCEDSLVLFKSDVYTFFLDVAYKGKTYTYCDIELQSADPSVLAVEESNVAVQAMGLGQTTVTVTLKYEGAILETQEVAVEVIENYKIAFNTQTGVDLVTNVIDTEKYAEEFTLTTTLLHDGEPVENAELSYELQDTGIVSFDRQTGLIKALAIGKTTLKVAFEKDGQTYETLLPIRVEKEKIPLSGEVLLSAKDGLLDVSKFDLSPTEIVEVNDLFEGREINLAFTDVDGNKIQITNPRIGARTICLETEEKRYVLEATVATVVVRTAADFEYIMTNIGHFSEEEYVVLENDIDMGGIDLTNSKWMTGGTIDGRGHTISNFRTVTGFRSNGTGVFKNLGLKFTKLEWGETYPAPIIPGDWAGQMENVFVEVTMGKYDYDTALFARQFSEGAAFKNCVFVVHLTGEGSGMLYADYAVDSGKDATFENVYVVCSDTVYMHGEAYDNNGLYVKSTVKEIDKIGNMFEVDNNALFFDGNIVYSAGEEYSMKNNAANEITVQGVSASTVTKVTVFGDSKPRTFAQNGAKLTFAADVFRDLDVGAYVLKLTMSDGGNYYVTTRFEMVTQALNNETVYLLSAASTFDPKTVGINGTVTSVYVEGSLKPLTYTISGNKVQFSNVSDLGDVKLVVATTNKDAYAVDVCFASMFIETATDFATLMNTNKHFTETDYVVVKNDIDMGGAEYGNSNWIAGGTLDGRGHTISNFRTVTGFRSNGSGVIKNIGLKFTKLDWSATYPAPVIPGEFYGQMENVFVEVEMGRYDYDTAVFGREFNVGAAFKNCLFVVHLTGEGSGKLYADYTVDSGKDATFENVYVVCSDTVYMHGEAYDNNGLYVKSSISQVGNVGDVIKVEGNVVLFNGKIVCLENVETIDLYNNAASKATVNGLSGKTVNKITVLGETEERAFTQNGAELSFTAATFLDLPIGQSVLRLETSAGVVYVQANFTATTQVLNNVAPVLAAASSTLNLTTLGITGTPLSVTIKNQATPVYSIVGSTITFTGVTVFADQVLVIVMSDGQAFEVNVCFAYIVVSTAADFTNLVKGYGSSNANRHLSYYVAITDDIDMQGAVIGNSYGWGTGGTIDGRGHKIYNFTLSGYIRPVSSPSMTIKNLAMVYTSNPNASYYSLSLCGGNASNVSGTIYENVYLEITVARPAADLGVFGHTFGAGSSIKNSVVVLNVTGTGAGTIYADSTTASATKATFENAYVVSGATIAYHEGEAYNNNGLYVKSSVSAITTIGGDFEVKADGLYWNKKLVKAI